MHPQNVGHEVSKPLLPIDSVAASLCSHDAQQYFKDLLSHLQILHLAGSSVEADAFAPLAEIESFGSSFVYGKNSGWPGIYLRRTSGTLIPCSV